MKLNTWGDFWFFEKVWPKNIKSKITQKHAGKIFFQNSQYTVSNYSNLYLSHMICYFRLRTLIFKIESTVVLSFLSPQRYFSIFTYYFHTFPFWQKIYSKIKIEQLLTEFLLIVNSRRNITNFLFKYNLKALFDNIFWQILY